MVHLSNELREWHCHQLNTTRVSLLSADYRYKFRIEWNMKLSSDNIYRHLGQIHILIAIQSLPGSGAPPTRNCEAIGR